MAIRVISGGLTAPSGRVRADPAEKWLVAIRREIEDHFMPSFAVMYEKETHRPERLAGETARAHIVSYFTDFFFEPW